MLLLPDCWKTVDVTFLTTLTKCEETNLCSNAQIKIVGSTRCTVWLLLCNYRMIPTALRTYCTCCRLTGE